MRRFRRALSWYGLVIDRILPHPFVRIICEKATEENAPVPCIYVCNHRSASDPFLMGLLPYEMVQIANIWPFRLPVLGFYARRAGYLSVNEMPVEEFYEKAGRLLTDGVSLVAFPEGTRAAPGQVGPFHSAVFRLAMQCRTPIVPLCISGNERIPPRGTGWLDPGVIRVRRLAAIRPETYRDWSAFHLKMHVRDRIVAELGAMEKTA
jgi:1-acyl-sn-glycerol-3-phosphate acyltransferase